MRNDVFIASLARGAVAASVAGAWMLPQKQTEDIPSAEFARDQVYANTASSPEAGTEAAANQSVTLTMTENPVTWDKKLEKEFRILALAEAKGSLTQDDSRRLNELTNWRNSLLFGQSAEEISLQLKRDKLIERMESLLREYVEFQETTHSKRSAA